MRILVVAATEAEIEPLIRYNSTISQKVDAVITGVGIIHTAYAVLKQLQKQTYDLVINAGICGAFNRDIAIGEVMSIATETFSEIGAQDGDHFLSVFELGLQNENAFPFKAGRLHLTGPEHSAVLKELKRVHGITVNTVHGNETAIAEVVKRYQPDVESMEGAACAFVCAQEHINCIELRAVSNYVERRNKENWNIPLAVNNLNEALIKLVNELSA